MIIDFNDPQKLWPLLLNICRVQPRWRDNAFKAREIVKTGMPAAESRGVLGD